MKRKKTLGVLVLGLTALVGCPINNAATPNRIISQETVQIPADCKKIQSIEYSRSTEYITGFDSEGNLKTWYQIMGWSDRGWNVREYVLSETGPNNTEIPVTQKYFAGEK